MEASAGHERQEAGAKEVQNDHQDADAAAQGRLEGDDLASVWREAASPKDRREALDDQRRQTALDQNHTTNLDS